jgi:L-asparaginase II
VRVEQVRGTMVEAWHEVHAAVVDRQGHLVATAGDPTLVTFWRSAAKPFQALPLVADGVVERFGLTSEELALACASHSSEPGQVARVREFLAKLDLSERDLLCGPHRPLSEHVAQEYERHGVRLSAIYSNCSGKHTAMLALARHHGWPTAGYTRPENPVQQRCLAEVSRWTGVPTGAIQTAVDGCGVVCFGVPLVQMALAYARVGAGVEVGAEAENEEPGPRVIAAMLRHPELVAGAGRPCTELMQAHPGRVVTKVGAEGLYCALLVEEGWGVALKVADGHAMAAGGAIAAGRAERGLGPRPTALGPRPNVNTRGETVGELRVQGRLTR